MSKLSNFIKGVILPENVDKERRDKILRDGIIEIWKNDGKGRKLEEAKGTFNKARSRADKKNPNINEN